MNYTPINFPSSNRPVNKPSLRDHLPKNPLILASLLLLISSLVVMLAYIGNNYITQKRAAPQVVRWCRLNSFGGDGISAPGQVTANPDGSFSFTATTPFDPDEACVTIRERMDEVVVPGLPGATRANTCVAPITSNADCSVGLSWDGPFGKNPTQLRVSGRLQGSTCNLYLLAIQGIPVCARASTVVVKMAATPTPTPKLTVSPTPTKVTPTPTETPKPTKTPTPTNTPTPTFTPVPSNQPSPTPTNTPTPGPTSVATPTPTTIIIVQATNTPGPTVIVQNTTAPSVPKAGFYLPSIGLFAVAVSVIVFGIIL